MRRSRRTFVEDECLDAAASNGSVYVAVGDGGTIVTSPDMTSWSVNTEWDTFYALAPSTTGMVAVGLHGSVVGLECWGVIFTDGFEAGNTTNWSIPGFD